MASEEDVKPTMLEWNVETLEDGVPKTYTAFEVEMWEADARFAVIGPIAEWKNLYIVQADVDRRVTVLMEVDVQEASLARAADVRVPSSGAWLWTSVAGNIRVVGSMKPLSRAEIAEAVGGHNPPPTGTTTDPRASGTAGW